MIKGVRKARSRASYIGLFETALENTERAVNIQRIAEVLQCWCVKKSCGEVNGQEQSLGIYATS